MAKAEAAGSQAALVGLESWGARDYNPIVRVCITGREMLVPAVSKGEKEAAVRTAIIKFEQEFLGRGPDEVRVFIVRDMLVVRLKGVLTPAERQLAKTAEGIDMVKRLRQNLIAQGRDRLCEQVADLIGAKITALFTDIDTVVGERIFVFTLESDLEANVR